MVQFSLPFVLYVDLVSPSEVLYCGAKQCSKVSLTLIPEIVFSELRGCKAGFKLCCCFPYLDALFAFAKKMHFWFCFPLCCLESLLLEPSCTHLIRAVFPRMPDNLSLPLAFANSSFPHAMSSLISPLSDACELVHNGH